MKNLILNFKRIVLSVVLIGSVQSFANEANSENAQEVVRRIETEQLSDNQKINLIKATLQPLDTVGRINFYRTFFEKALSLDLSRKAMDELILLSLADFKKITKYMQVQTQGMNILLEWAINDKNMSPAVADTVIDSIKEMDWIADGLSLSYDKNYVAATSLVNVFDQFEEDHKDLKKQKRQHQKFKRLFLTFLNMKLSVEAQSSVVWGLLKSNMGRTYCWRPLNNVHCDAELLRNRSFTLRHWSLETLKKERAELLKRDRDFSLGNIEREFKLGYAFEKWAATDSKSLEEKIDYLTKMVEDEYKVKYLGNVMIQFLLNNPDQEKYLTGSKAKLVSTFIRNTHSVIHHLSRAGYGGYGTDKEVYEVLLKLPYVLQMDSKLLLEVYAPLINPKYVNSFNLRDYRKDIVNTSYYSDDSDKEFPGMQNVFEIMADSFGYIDSQAEAANESTFQENDKKHSTVGALLTLLEDCLKSDEWYKKNYTNKPKVCQALTSIPVILGKVAENKNIVPHVAERAREILLSMSKKQNQ